MDNIRALLKNQTLTSSGSGVVRGFPGQEIVIFWNITGPVTGSGPTLQFTVQEVDPSDEATTNGQSTSSSVLNGVGVGKLIITLANSPAVLVTWTVGGSSPSFGGTSLTSIVKTVGNIIGITGSILVNNFPNSQGVTGAVGVVGPIGVTGPVLSNQGTPALIANAWPTKITDGTNLATVKAGSLSATFADPALVVSVSPNTIVRVGGSIASGATGVGNPVPVSGIDSFGITRVIGSVVDRTAILSGFQTGVPIIGQSSNVGRLLRSNRLGMPTVGYQTLLAMDPIEGSAVNSWLWTQSTATMAIAQGSGSLTLNSGNTTTTATDAIITTIRQFPIINQAPIVCSFRAQINQTTNAVQELGFGAPAGTTATINNGAFFRVNSSGAVKAVTSFNGSENVSSTLATISATSYYLFLISIEDNGARFVVEDTSGVPIIDFFLSFPLTVPMASITTHLPAFARVYNSGTAGTAPVTKISGFQVWQYDINNGKSWGEQLSSTGRSSNISPTASGTFQAQQLAAGAAPATVTPLNSTVAYTTLGGEFSLNGTASSENLLGVFGFTVPSPYSLHIQSIYMPQPFLTTALGATVNIQEWCFMVASSAVPSSATGQRYALGTFTAAASAVAGTVYNGQPLNVSFDAPIVVLPGQVLQVLVKLISGSAAGVYRGSILINGYYE